MMFIVVAKRWVTTYSYFTGQIGSVVPFVGWAYVFWMNILRVVYIGFIKRAWSPISFYYRMKWTSYSLVHRCSIPKQIYTLIKSLNLLYTSTTKLNIMKILCK